MAAALRAVRLGGGQVARRAFHTGGATRLALPSISSEAEFDAKVAGSTKPVVIKYWADWCGPCHMITPTMEALEKSTPEMSFFQIDVDALPGLAQRWRVSALPTVAVMVPSGGAAPPTEAARVLGADVAGLKKMIGDFAAKK